MGDDRPEHLTILEWFRERGIEPLDQGHWAALWAWRIGAPVQLRDGQRVYARMWLDENSVKLLARTTR